MNEPEVPAGGIESNTYVITGELPVAVSAKVEDRFSKFRTLKYE